MPLKLLKRPFTSANANGTYGGEVIHRVFMLTTMKAVLENM
jgi:hypothetical protein